MAQECDSPNNKTTEREWEPSASRLKTPNSSALPGSRTRKSFWEGRSGTRCYRDYANLVIGLYFAAAGIKFEDGMWFADTYAKYSSSFHEPMDEIYTHLPKRDVLDMKMGYDLYESGRIAAGR